MLLMLELKSVGQAYCSSPAAVAFSISRWEAYLSGYCLAWLFEVDF